MPRLPVLALWLAACARAPEPARPTRLPSKTEERWVDLERVSVELESAAVRSRAPVEVGPLRHPADAILHTPEVVLAIGDRAVIASDRSREVWRVPLRGEGPTRSWIVDDRILVVMRTESTTIVDLVQAFYRQASHTFDEPVRWVGGYRVANADLLVSSENQLAKIELGDTFGGTLWTRPPLRGSRGDGLIVADHAVVVGFDPSGGPVEMAIVTNDAETWRGPVALLEGRCSKREVKLVHDFAASFFVVATCDARAVVETRRVPDGRRSSRVESGKRVLRSSAMQRAQGARRP